MQPNIEQENKRGHVRRALLPLLAMAPLGWLAWFFVYALRARLALGRWPRPGQPDPYELGFHLHHVTVTLGFPFALACALTVVVMAPFLKGIHRSALSRLCLVLLAVLSTAISIWVARSNPRYLFTWFMD